MPLEREIQSSIVQLLRIKRYEVLITNAGIRSVLARAAAERGESIGHLCTPGVPDLLISGRKWPAWCWLGMEVKRPEVGVLSPAQKELEQLGRIVVCRSPEEADAAVRAFELSLGVRK